MDEYFTEIAKELRAGRPVAPTTVRDLLYNFDVQRRGYAIVKKIRDKLEGAGLATFPDFEDAWIDAPIGFVLATKKEDEKNQENPEFDEGHSDDNQSTSSESDIPHMDNRDPTFRIGRLQSANQKIISIKPDESISKAVTEMLAVNISQLPVMTNEREIKGIITWQTIASKAIIGDAGTFAREFMEPHYEVRYESSIFSAIPVIVLHNYVLIRNRENKITGIVTASDLSQEFRKLTEPFLLLSEIENMVRNMIEPKFSVEELSVACDAGANRKIKNISDLNFGEYIRLLENQERWTQFGIKADRKVFCEKLSLTREIRNDVMHFKLNPKEEDLEVLRNCSEFLKYLSNI